MKAECQMEDLFETTKSKLQKGGLFLTTIGRDGRKNVMTIGWGLMGIIWGEPVFMVAVRPSRHTFKLIEETSEFTVNIPGDNMEDALAYCGKVSGRDYDKFRESKLDIEDGRKVKAPLITKCVGHFECKVIGKSKLVPEMLSEDVLKRAYPRGDYHTVYYGRPLSILKER